MLNEDYIRTPSAIRTHDSSVRATKDASDHAALTIKVTGCANCEAGGFLVTVAVS
jgi:hypothetical protein